MSVGGRLAVWECDDLVLLDRLVEAAAEARHYAGAPTTAAAGRVDYASPHGRYCGHEAKKPTLPQG